MGKRNYTSEQSWPKHPKKTVNEFFDVAKLHDWTLIEETSILDHISPSSPTIPTLMPVLE